MAPKYIFVTGGVVSSLGKGLAAASIGALLEARGFRVTLQKMDPYINVDAGTMSPYQHGEVFVTDDGGETDLDLGHYERFTSSRVTRDHNVTTGKVYYSVIQKERRGDYLGRTVQVIPHITDEIKASIRKVSRDTDVVIVEVGGTVGDIEGLPFLEAVRQFRKDVGREHVIYVHLTLVPYMQAASELKTKATQHSVKELRAIGIQPDVLLCRTDRYLPPGIKSKIALFCDVEEEAVITAKDVETIYEVPLNFHREGLDEIIVKLLGLEPRRIDLSRWEAVVRRVKSPLVETRIAVVGKYVELKDSYKSLVEALAHGGIANEARVDVQWVDAEHIERDGAEAQLRVSTASWCRVASAIGGSRARSRRSATRASGGCRSSASVWACSARSSSTRATSAGSPARTPRSSTRRRRTSSSISCPSSAGSPPRAARCG